MDRQMRRLLLIAVVLLGAAAEAAVRFAAATEPATAVSGETAAAGQTGQIDLGPRLDELIAARGRQSDGARLAALFDLTWRWALQEYPELATSIGVPGENDRWSDSSLAAIARRNALAPKVVAAAESIDRSRLNAAERLNYDLFLRQARLEVEGNRFHREYLAISQMGGVQQGIPQLLSYMPTQTIAQYRDVLARLRGIPRVIEDTMALLERGRAAGITPPRVTLRDVPAQVVAQLVDDPAKSPMLTAFTKFPAAIAAPEQEALRREAYEVFRGAVAPAFRKLHDYLEATYVPQARDSIAMSAMPDGQAWYAYAVRTQTTTDLAPRQIHEIGLAEVKRIRAEMDALIQKIGFKGSFADFQLFLRTDPRFFFTSSEELLTAYRDLCKRIDPQLIKLFGKLPRLPYGVQRMPAYSEKSQTSAYYDPGSLAGGRPGYFFVNTYDLKSRPKWGMEQLALHEAVPGHHLQVALAQELEGVPEWRKYDSYTAYAEGWGLYAESLGAEVGLYQDPYSDFGRLTAEIWRALRLVVDTGLHALGWTRQQAIDYMKANSANTEHDITVEVDRYIVWPGQALAYKIGELKIKEVRAYAEKELGPKFDLRSFHDHVLANGALPLDVLDGQIRAWVAEAKGAPPADAAR
ncbi:MAG TPA: DUF885 domain-containing protein [Thermoanaerobaculia bacterium]|nr:DUF885 domain-containing protein [Thermoanaerobaculia bacterium]